MAYKIFVVDDDKNIIRSLSFILKRENYEVISSQNSLDTLSIARKEKPDLIILDIGKLCVDIDPDLIICDLMLPDMDGLEIVKWIKGAKIKKRLPVIILSAKDKDGDVRKGYKVKADYYITKPFTQEQLLYGVKLMLKT